MDDLVIFLKTLPVKYSTIIVDRVCISSSICVSQCEQLLGMTQKSARVSCNVLEKGGQFKKVFLSQSWIEKLFLSFVPYPAIRIINFNSN